MVESRNVNNLRFSSKGEEATFVNHSKNRDYIEIYTDGGCLGNQFKNKQNIGAYGAILSYRGHYKLIGNSVIDTTNNRMELQAILIALQSLKSDISNYNIYVFSDSSYCINGIGVWMHNWVKNGWKKKPGAKHLIKNDDLWKALYETIKDLESNNNKLQFNKVKGHVGVIGNEIADDICNYLMGVNKLSVLSE